MMNVADRRQATALVDARQWLNRFEAALKTGDASKAADLFIADGLWRDGLALTWTIQTESRRAGRGARLRERLVITQPKNFHIPPRRTPPRWVTRAGKEAL